MLEHSYVPPNPIQTPAFREAEKIFPHEITPILSMADALQDATWKAVKDSNVPVVEVVMSQVELALDMCSEAALIAVKMAGYSQEADGRWYARVSDGDNWIVLEVGENFLSDYYKLLSTYH